MSRSERSGRNIENGNNNEQKVRQWLTRKNPFAEVWDTDILPLLSEHPTLDPSFILEQLQQSYPDKYPDNQLRTLQRHVKKYKAIHGNDKDVNFCYLAKQLCFAKYGYNKVLSIKQNITFSHNAIITYCLLWYHFFTLPFDQVNDINIDHSNLNRLCKFKICV